MKKVLIILASFFLILTTLVTTTYKNKNTPTTDKTKPPTQIPEQKEIVLNETSEIYKDKPESCLANLGLDYNLTDEVLKNDFIVDLIKNNCLWANNPALQYKDIDGDGIEEIIFQAGPAGAVTGRFTIVYLIDNEKVVFTDRGDSMRMLFTNNGFEIKKTHELYDGAGCCPSLFELKKYTYDGQKATLISTEKINERVFTEYFPIKEGAYWKYKGIKKEQQENGEVITSDINKKIIVTKIEDLKNYTVISLEDTEYPLLIAKNYTVDFEPANNLNNKFTLTFPLEVRTRWGSDVDKRDDGYYGWEIEEKISMDILGKNYENCYRIAYKTLSGTSYKTFCYGIGIVEEGYTHNGTILEEKYNLVDINIVN